MSSDEHDELQIDGQRVSADGRELRDVAEGLPPAVNSPLHAGVFGELGEWLAADLLDKERDTAELDKQFREELYEFAENMRLTGESHREADTNHSALFKFGNTDTHRTTSPREEER